MSLSVDLKDIPWKRHINTVIKVLIDTKVLGLLALMGFTMYGIGWDTVLRPSLEMMKARDEAINTQKSDLDAKSDLQKKYGTLQEQLKGLNVQLIAISASDSPKLISVGEQADLLKLVKGESRDENTLPALPPPHNKRENVSLTPTGQADIDILQPDAPPGQAPAAAPAPSSPSAGPPGMPGSRAGTEAAATSLPASRFDYDLKATGTYPALMDLLNELVIRNKLIKINKITISRPADTSTPQPDAKDVPDYPVKLDMTVALSIYLYVTNTTP